MKYLLILLALLVLFSCEDTSMTIPLSEFTGSYEIEVHPFHIERVVTISDGTEIIREYTIPANDSIIIASDLAFGHFRLSATAEGYIPQSKRLTINEVVGYTSPIYLSTTPDQIYSLTPSPGNISSLSPYTYPQFTNTKALINIQFDGGIDTVGLRSMITLDPPLDCKIDSLYYREYRNTKCILSIPMDQFFTTPVLTITLDSSIIFETTASLYNSYSFSYIIDTTLSAEAYRRMYLKESDPTVNQTSVSVSNNCEIYFNKEVNKASVESAFSISPAATPTFWWGSFYDDEVLNFTFAEDLRPSTSYTITIDTTMKFADGTQLKYPIEIPFTTEDLYITSISPKNGEEISTDYYTQFRIGFSADIDSASFVNAYSIVPESPYITTSFYDDSVVVNHGFLDAGTEYTITIDSTLTDKFGAPYGREIKTTFTTAE